MPYNRSLLPNVEVLLSDMVKTSRCSTKLLFMTLNFYSWFFFHNFDKISKIFQNSKIFPKFQIFSKISIFFQNFKLFPKFRPNFRISTKFHNFDQFFEFSPNFIIFKEFKNFDQFLEFRPNSGISTKWGKTVRWINP